MKISEIEGLEDKERELIISIVEYSKHMLEEQNGVSPVMILTSGRDIDMISGESFGFGASDEGKEMFILSCKYIARKNQSTLSFFISEAWVVRLDLKGKEKPTEEDLAITPSQHPDKQECVVFALELSNGKQYVAHAKLIREPFQVPTFDVDIDFVELPIKAGQSQSKFTGILPNSDNKLSKFEESMVKMTLQCDGSIDLKAEGELKVEPATDSFGGKIEEDPKK